MADSKGKILCIDDDPDILSFLRVVLEGGGYAFVGAESAEDGLRAWHDSRPDAVIVDLMMEEVDSGAGFVRELMALGNKTPVFLLSSVGDGLNLAADYAPLGLSGVFQKPLSAAQLLTVLGAALAPIPAR